MSSPDPPGPKNVYFVALGCPKNRVDSEIMLGQLTQEQFCIVANAQDADVLVVNTCGFIEDAKRESIATILELAREKERDRNKRLIVTGCLVQRHASELAKEIPEIDALLGTSDYARIVEVATARREKTPRVHVGAPIALHDATTPRINTFLPHSVYVKVAEGCDQKCAFCIIPSLRGQQRSRPVDDIVLEAENLAARGVVEMNLVAQDLTGYGHDLRPRADLAGLLRALGKAKTPPWIRLHYAYPRPLSKALLAALSDEPKVLPYFDLPLQHISDAVLRRMARGRPRRFIVDLLGKLRSAVSDLTLRTAFIVGFPGETQRDFSELVSFVRDEDFAHIGVFCYSPEEGTPAFAMDGAVAREIAEERRHILLEIAKKKARAKNAARIGARIEILVDGRSAESELLAVGRHAGQAPDVDGVTYITEGEVAPGDRVEVEITEAFDYDLAGKVVRMLAPAPRRPEHARLDAAKMARPTLRVLA